MPAPSTIRAWYGNLECNESFIKEAFDHLKNVAEKSSQKQQVNVIMDGMSIRQQIIYSRSEKQYHGYITFGTDAVKPKVASNALVFMVSGINAPYKLPVAYFFVDKLKAEELGALLDIVISKLIDCGLVVRCATSDGDKTNLAAFKLLGADFQNFNPYFINKNAPNIKIYVTLDACHSLKSARNVIANKKSLWNSKEDEIEWSFFEKLAQTNEKGNGVGAA